MSNLYFIVRAAAIRWPLIVYPFNSTKTLSILFLLLFSSTAILAQRTTPAVKKITLRDSLKKTSPVDTIKPGNGPVKEQLKRIGEEKKTLKDATAGGQPVKNPLIDTTIQNKYGDLLNDDPKFNKRYALWKPLVNVIGVDVFTWSMDRFMLNESFSHIGPATWKYNLRKGWQWDDDRFGVNFIAHPYTGSMYFNAARSQGYNYIQSVPFTAAGSLMWEYFGENTRPSYNDIINTTANGAFLGEIFYRLSSNILDDRATGGNRVFREIAAGLIDPVRGLNRLLQGKSFRKTTTEVYQKEPLNVTIAAGVHKINVDDNTIFGNGPTDAMFNIQLDYGNPFEDIHRKPFDLFRFRTEFSFGSGRKILDNVTGYGILVGNNTGGGKFSMLYGAFQYYDYWDNLTYELGTIGLGGGLITKYSFSKDIIFYTSLHAGFIPLAGNSTRFGPDTASQVRDYTYNDGLEANLEATLNLGKYVSASAAYYYYILHTFVGPAGTNYVAILEPKLTIQLFKNTSIGFEQFIYYDDRYLKNFKPIFSVRTEQKIFLSLFLEDSQRKGRYN